MTIKHGISNEAYHEMGGISKSTLDLIHVAPALVEWHQKAPKSTMGQQRNGALTLGTAIHAAILEPNRFADEYIRCPEFNLRTNAGKDDYAAFCDEADGGVILSQDDYSLVVLARDSALAHPTFRQLFDCDHVCEASIFWDWETESGRKVLCKCRPDFMLSNKPLVVDIKTTANISKFSTSCWEYRYHVQDQHYSDGVSREYSGEDCAFYFLVIGTSLSAGMLPVHLFELKEEDKAIGRRERDSDLEAYAWCLDSSAWPGVEPLSLPPWAKQSLT